jgi:glycosyltransferase involved in cell wall biosynthesis
MAKTLYLFTNSFPYGNTSEVPFLINELNYLGHKFENIILVPQNKNSDLELKSDKYIVDLGLIEESETRNWRAIFLLLNREVVRELLLLASRGQVAKIRRLWWGLVTISRTIRWVNRKIKYDESIIFYTYWFTDLTTALALAKKNSPNISLISRAHRYDLYEEQTSFRYFPLRSLALNKLDHLFLISQDGLNYMRAQFPLYSGKFSVSRLGANEQTMMTKPTQTPKKISIVSCAYIGPVKRIDLLCDALQYLSSMYADWIIIWNHFGGGRITDTEIINHKVNSFNPNMMTTLWGNVSITTIIDFYKREQVDLFVSVSESEGIPMSMMEAASFGIPIISTDVGGVHELVNNDNGLLLPEDISAVQIGKAIAKFISGNNHVSKRQVIKDTWQKQFSAQVNYSDFASKLSKLLM